MKNKEKIEDIIRVEDKTTYDQVKGKAIESSIIERVTTSKLPMYYQTTSISSTKRLENSRVDYQTMVLGVMVLVIQFVWPSTTHVQESLGALSFFVKNTFS